MSLSINLQHDSPFSPMQATVGIAFSLALYCVADAPNSSPKQRIPQMEFNKWKREDGPSKTKPPALNRAAEIDQFKAWSLNMNAKLGKVRYLLLVAFVVHSTVPNTPSQIVL